MGELDEARRRERTDPVHGSPDVPEAKVDAPNTSRASNLSDAELKSQIKGTPKNNDPTSLANELRFERYKRRGGEKSFDEWFEVSRGGRRGGPNHQKIQGDLLSQNTDAIDEAVFGDRVADVFWPNGPNGKPVIHQIGGRNPVRGDAIARERQAIEELRAWFKQRGQDVEIWFWDKATPGAKGPAFKDPDLLPNWIPGSSGT
ncbi:MAG: hypothetical protein JNL58_25780 [Planctomyces sp.]|nr:hypothetical protein [Planctomyces sp.]